MTANTELVTWEIENLKYAQVQNDHENVILNVRFKLIAWYDDETFDMSPDNMDEYGMPIDESRTIPFVQGTTYHGTCDLDPPEGSNFIPLDELQKDNVVLWVKQKLGEDAVNKMESDLKLKRDEMIDTNITYGRPQHWENMV